MSTVWFTSDTHFSHNLVAGLRLFPSAQVHDEALVEVWNDYVRPKDTVWLLGDVSISSNPRRWAPQVDRLHGRIHLVFGNHDGGSPHSREAYRWVGAYAERFASVHSAARRRISGKEILLSHYPYDGDHGADRYRQWRLRDFGVPLLHGHTHSDDVVSRSAEGTLQLHVGWDAWQRPVRDSEIYALLEANR